MRKKLKNNIDIIKVNQLTGAWVGIILSIILKKPLYIRTGYDVTQKLFKLNKNGITAEDFKNKDGSRQSNILGLIEKF